MMFERVFWKNWIDMSVFCLSLLSFDPWSFDGKNYKSRISRTNFQRFFKYSNAGLHTTQDHTRSGKRVLSWAESAAHEAKSVL